MCEDLKLLALLSAARSKLIGQVIWFAEYSELDLPAEGTYEYYLITDVYLESRAWNKVEKKWADSKYPIKARLQPDIPEFDDDVMFSIREITELLESDECDYEGTAAGFLKGVEV